MDYKVCDSLCFRFIGLICLSRTFVAMSVLSLGFCVRLSGTQEVCVRARYRCEKGEDNAKLQTELELRSSEPAAQGGQIEKLQAEMNAETDLLSS